MTGARFAATVSRVLWLGILIGSVSAFVLDPASGATGDKTGDCGGSPKGAAPPGERWHYRVERGSQRHCWYTRAGAPGKAVKKAAPQNAQVPASETTATVPLQLSVANARAEAVADLSVQPQEDVTAALPDTLQIGEPKSPGWTLAERWSSHSQAAAPGPLPLASSSPAVQAESSPAYDDATPESLVYVASGTIGLLGLSLALTATLIRRRQRNRRDRDRSLGDRHMNDAGIRPSFIDLNDEPLMTWRKKPRDAVRIIRQSDATRVEAFIAAPAAAPRQTPTARPAGRA